MRIIGPKVNKIVSLGGLPQGVLCVYSAYIGNYLENYKKLIGQNIRKRRKELGLTQEALAEAIDSDQSRIARWERGLHIPDPKYREKLYEALKTTESKLLGISEQPANAPQAGKSDVLPAILRGLTTLNDSQLNTVLDLINGFSASSANSDRDGSIG